LALFERAREIYVQLEAPRGVAIQDYLIGKAYCGLGKWIDALNAFGSAAIALTGLGDPLVLGRVLHHQGLVHAQLGELDEAMLAQSRSLQLAVQIGNRRGQAQALTALAELIDRRGDPKAAEQLRLRAARVVVQSSVGEPVFSWACSGSETREMTTRQRLLPASTSPRSPAGS
jgi:tetratricopeptide (TPR) repeat protein